MKHTIGAITIGQAPRTDVMPEIQPLLGSDIEVVEMGALDGLTRAEIETFAPQGDDYILHTRMCDGTSVTIAERHILPRMQSCIDSLTQQGVELVMLLCTGKFPTFRSTTLLIEPQKITDSIIGALAGKQHKIGIMTPLAGQIEQVTANLQDLKDNVVAVSASPYSAVDEITPAAQRLGTEGVDVSVLHCIGYTMEMKGIVKETTGKPVILARALTARVVCELLS